MNTYDSSNASIDTPSRLQPQTARDAKTAARKAAPPPNAHQNASVERARAHNSQATLAAEAAQAAKIPTPESAAPAPKTRREAAANTAAKAAPSAAAWAAVRATAECPNESIKAKNDSDQRQNKNAPRRRAVAAIEPVSESEP